MAIFADHITDMSPPGLDCGDNVFDGFSIAVSINRSRVAAKREASRRTRTLRDRQWREIRRLRCPQLDCRRRVVTHVWSPGPRYWFEIKLWPGVWAAGAVRRWSQTVECRYPEG